MNKKLKQNDKEINLNKKLDSISRSIENLKMNENSAQWLNSAEACKFLKVSQRTLQRYRSNKIIPYAQFVGKFYYKRPDLERHLENSIKTDSLEKKGGK